MEERRRSDDKNWEEIKDFISESREYRKVDEIKQDYQIKAVNDLNSKVAIQNGRVAKLEQWQLEIQNKIKDSKESKGNIQTLITIVASIVMAVSAVIVIFKK